MKRITISLQYIDLPIAADNIIGSVSMDDFFYSIAYALGPLHPEHSLTITIEPRTDVKTCRITFDDDQRMSESNCRVFEEAIYKVVSKKVREFSGRIYYDKCDAWPSQFGALLNQFKSGPPEIPKPIKFPTGTAVSIINVPPGAVCVVSIPDNFRLDQKEIDSIKTRLEDQFVGTLLDRTPVIVLTGGVKMEFALKDPASAESDIKVVESQS